MVVPRLWTETIEEHRDAVRDATIDATAELVAEHGLRGVTMSRIAQRTGIGRATLYKYFSDVDAILSAWHERLVTDHLRQLADLGTKPLEPGERLRTVLTAYALLLNKQQPHAGSEIAAQLHDAHHVTHADTQLRTLLTVLITGAGSSGEIRDDIPTDELVSYTLNALTGATRLRSQAAVRRLTELTLAGLRPPS
jgi:AcrR family transcriptional regulator